MRKVLTALMFVLLISIFSCKSEADKKYETAIENTTSFIKKWEDVTNKTFNVEDWRAFRSEMKALNLANNQLGVVKANLSEKQQKEIMKLYSTANAIHSRLATAKMQDDFTARVTNRVVEYNELDEENISLTF